MIKKKKNGSSLINRIMLEIHFINKFTLKKIESRRNMYIKKLCLARVNIVLSCVLLTSIAGKVIEITD